MVEALLQRGFFTFSLPSAVGRSCDRLLSASAAARTDALATAPELLAEIHTRVNRWDVKAVLDNDVETILRAALYREENGDASSSSSSSSSSFPQESQHESTEGCGQPLCALLTPEAMLTQLSVVTSLAGAPQQLRHCDTVHGANDRASC